MKLTVSLPTFEQEVLIEHVLWWTVILFVVLLVAVVAIGMLLLNYNMRPLWRGLIIMNQDTRLLPCLRIPI